MSIFGFSSKKEVKEKEQRARDEGREAGKETGMRLGRQAGIEEGKQAVLKGQQRDLSNLAKGSQLTFSVPYFDVHDPRFENFAVPVSVHGSLIYEVKDIEHFKSINKAENVNDNVFLQKLKGKLTMYVKGVVTNAPYDNQIPVLQLERKILDISELVQQLVTPKIETDFGINIRSLEITHIMVDKDSRGYRELKTVTTDIEKETFQTRSSLNLDAMKRQQEMNLGGQEELQRMQLEHQRETMRIQREEMQRASRLQTETNFLGAHQADLNASVQTAQAQNQGRLFSSMMPPMPGMGGMPQMLGAVPQVQYMLGINGQQLGPYDWNQLKQLVQQGQLTQQTYVWKQGMMQWQMACEVQELTPLFQNIPSQMPPMPPIPGL